MITTNLTGNLGNHMWQYAVCRTVAQKLGYEWGINSSPTHDYHRGMNQMYFMDVDFGKPVDGITQDFHENWTVHNHNGDIINITMLDPRVWEMQDNSRMIGHNGAFGGIYQSENYFYDIKDDVKSWFKIKPEFANKYEEKMKELGIVLDDNTCVINFRGGEYRGIPKVLCRKEYWNDSINHMLSLNPNMKFIVISDDPECASWFMPFQIPVFHVEIGFDFYVVNQAKWLIVSNSTFGWWAAWLNSTANKILAPKYFGAHNTSDGYWCVGENYTRSFHYVDRDGNISDYETCKNEAIEFYKSKNIIKDENI
jgi:hypothetical protein